MGLMQQRSWVQASFCEEPADQGGDQAAFNSAFPETHTPGIVTEDTGLPELYVPSAA
jgi:hypothetical protein